MGKFGVAIRSAMPAEGDMFVSVGDSPVVYRVNHEAVELARGEEKIKRDKRAAFAEKALDEEQMRKQEQLRDWTSTLCSAAGRGDTQRCAKLVAELEDLLKQLELNDLWTELRKLDPAAVPATAEGQRRTPMASLIEWIRIAKVNGLHGATRFGGSTALHQAAWKGHSDTVLALVEYGARVNSRDIKSRTPLHDACRNGNAQLVSILLRDLKADPALLSDTGENAEVIAGRLGHDAVCEEFESIRLEFAGIYRAQARKEANFGYNPLEPDAGSTTPVLPDKTVKFHTFKFNV